MNARRFATLAILASLLGIGCSSQSSSPDDVRQKAANATAAVKRDATAVAQGVKEGWSRSSPLDINTASREQLQTLPGIDAKTADTIIADRPYNNSSELIQRKIVTKKQYDAIADKITANR